MVVKQTFRRSKISNVDLPKLSIFVACVATVAFRNWSFVVYVAQAFMVLMVLNKYSRFGGAPGIGLYAACYGFFSFWCLSSMFWAVDPERVLSATVGVFQFTVLGCCIALYVHMERDIDYVVNCLAWSSLALIAVLIVTTPSSAWSEAMKISENAASPQNRIGSSVGYHPNALGHICALCITIWYYKYEKGRKPLFILPMIALFLIVIFTKSRLSIVIFLACLVVYQSFASTGTLKKMGVLAILLLAAAVVIWALLNVPILYKMIGFRFAAMFGVTGSVDASTSTRAEMIQIALALFSERPLTGVGFSNYAVHYYYDYGGWALTYAHSNYAELLADVGIIGTAVYYAVPIWTLYNLVKYRNCVTNRELHALLTATTACLLIADYSSISYTNDFVQLLWASSFSYVLVIKQKAFKSVVPKSGLGGEKPLKESIKLISSERR